MVTEREMRIQLSRLQLLVDNLYRHLGIEQPDPVELAAEGEAAGGLSAGVQALVLQGQLIQAIKLHREETGHDLATAKAEVEGLVRPSL
jgi:ribosomal protein L7/L12